jgi:hypothetical protein
VNIKIEGVIFARTSYELLLDEYRFDDEDFDGRRTSRVIQRSRSYDFGILTDLGNLLYDYLATL